MRAGRVFVGLLILIGAAGILLKGASIYSRFLYLGILLVVSSWLWSQWVARALHVKRLARIVHANVGDLFVERFEIINASRLLAPWIEVVNETAMPFAAGSRLLTFIKGKQHISYQARTWLRRRGGFPLGPTALIAGDPFGLFRITKRFQETQSLVVRPMLVDIHTFLSPPGLLPGGQVIRRKSSDVTPHAAGVREYVTGDAMKRIHWPTSVRRAQLMVKEFEQDPQSEIWLFLDAQENVHCEKPFEYEDISTEAMLFGRRPKLKLPPSTLEYAVTITASLAHYFLKQRRAVGLVSAGRVFTTLSADRNERQESKILETLAFVEARGSLSLAGLVAAQAAQLPQGSSAILITPTVLPGLLAAVDDLQRRNLRPLVALLDASTFGGARGADKLYRALNEKGVPVYILPYGVDLVFALSNFSNQIISQEAYSWQRPALSHLT